MMYIENCNVYARVWDVTRTEKYTDLRVSTSEKRDDGTYANSNWFFRCIGHAHNKAKDLKKNDNIKVTRMKLTNETYNTKDGQKRSSLRVLVFEFEDNNNRGQQQNADQQESKPAPTPETEDDESMPF